MSEYNDMEIMGRVQSGETQLLGILYERHKASLYSYFYRCTNNRAKSEDLVQNVFLKVMKNVNNFKGSGEFKYWLFRIARNSWIDTAKSKEPTLKAVPLEYEHVKNQTTDDQTGMTVLQMRKEKLKRALEAISEDKREAIVMSRYQGLDYKTIAEITQSSESAIKSRVMRGLNEIRQIVNN